MKFEVLPVTDLMIQLYQKPLNVERFHEYLKLLQGNTKGDMVLPIGGFNPMAKEHVLEKLLELKSLNAEQRMRETLNELVIEPKDHKENGIVKVALNLSDDLKGGWTNRYTSDYDSKFKINALLSRNFCIPVFWAGENYDGEMIRQRTLEYAYRTIYWFKTPKPVSLKEHIEQEAFVARQLETSIKPLVSERTINFYNSHKNSESYDLIFNFLYGDSAAKSLEFPCYGIDEDFAGFKYAKLLGNV